MVKVNSEVLVEWVKLFDYPETPPSEARLVRPLTVEHLKVLSALANQRNRMADLGYRWSSGWHEKGAKERGFIVWRTTIPDTWEEVILQGPHLAVATALDQQPNPQCKNYQDYSSLDLELLPDHFIPRTNYQRSTDMDRYSSGLSHWGGKLCTAYWRVAWRRMVDPQTERTLNAAIIPPGPAHTDGTCTLSLPGKLETIIIAGLWSSLPLDYLTKVSAKVNINRDFIDRLPAPIDHPASRHLLLRAIRLNCLTRDYAPLWEELFEGGFRQDRWTPPFRWRAPLEDVTPEWTMATPLRTEYDRRAALVEIDALAAIMLGITAEQLCAIYRAQFGVLRKYEYRMFFDAQGRKIAKETHARGWKQRQGDYELAEQWWRDYQDTRESAANPDDIPVPDLPTQLRDRYRAPLVKPDREAEMTVAYEDFSRRLEQGRLCTTVRVAT
jgi:hypothetical protein